MKTLLLEFSSKTQRVNRPLNKKTLWYDSKTNQLMSFEGGQLDMEWIASEKRYVPKMKWDAKKKKMVPQMKEVNQVAWDKTDNSALVKNWVKQYERRFDFEINREESTNRGVAINVDDGQVDIVIDSLYEYRIGYSEIS